MTEIARPDIARPDNAAPYRKSGHRETCFNVRVDAHYKFMFAAGSIIRPAYRFHVCSSISFCFSYSYVRQTKLVSSLVNVWAHYKIVRSQHVAPRGTLRYSRPRLPRLPLPIPTPLKLSLPARAPACPCLRPRCCCCCCCRPAAIGTPYERQYG